MSGKCMTDPSERREGALCGGGHERSLREEKTLLLGSIPKIAERKESTLHRCFGSQTRRCSFAPKRETELDREREGQ